MLKISFFAGILKVNDENSRIRIQDADPDPLVRGMDPRIRIRIHPKMSWIRNTGDKHKKLTLNGFSPTKGRIILSLQSYDEQITFYFYQVMYNVTVS